MKKVSYIFIFITLILGIWLFSYSKKDRVYMDDWLGGDDLVDVTHLITSHQYTVIGENNDALRATKPKFLNSGIEDIVLSRFKDFLKRDSLLWSRFNSFSYPHLKYEYEYSHLQGSSVADIFSIQLPIQLPNKLGYSATDSLFYFRITNGEFQNSFSQGGWIIPNPNRIKK